MMIGFCLNSMQKKIEIIFSGFYLTKNNKKKNLKDFKHVLILATCDDEKAVKKDFFKENLNHLILTSYSSPLREIMPNVFPFHSNHM
jgi:hypothetical protein